MNRKSLISIVTVLVITMVFTMTFGAFECAGVYAAADDQNMTDEAVLQEESTNEDDGVIEEESTEEAVEPSSEDVLTSDEKED